MATAPKIIKCGIRPTPRVLPKPVAGTMESEWVLATDCQQWYVAKARFYDDDFGLLQFKSWVLWGPDGYGIGRITHWTVLPKLPK